MFAWRGAGRSAARGAVTALRVSREQAGECRVTFNDRWRYGSVRACWCNRATGRRQEVTAGSGEPVYALRDDQVDARTARYAAQARLDPLNRGAVTLSLSLRPAAPTASAETPLTLSGFRDGVDGRWIVTRVSRELSAGGLTAEAEAGQPTA